MRAGDAGSHSNKGWEQFTDKVIDVVDKYGGANLPSAKDSKEANGIGRGIVFMAWGSWAAKRVAKLNKVTAAAFYSSSDAHSFEQHKHYILQSAVRPSLSI